MVRNLITVLRLDILIHTSKVFQNHNFEVNMLLHLHIFYGMVLTNKEIIEMERLVRPKFLFFVPLENFFSLGTTVIFRQNIFCLICIKLKRCAEFLYIKCQRFLGNCFN